MTRFKTIATVLALASPLAIAQTPPAIVSPLPQADVEPVADARPLKVVAIDALKGEGLYYFSGTRAVNPRISGAPQGDRHPLKETASEQGVGAFNANISVANFVRDGERRPIGEPSFAIPEAEAACSWSISRRARSAGHRLPSAAVRQTSWPHSTWEI